MKRVLIFGSRAGVPEWVVRRYINEALSLEDVVITGGNLGPKPRPGANQALTGVDWFATKAAMDRHMRVEVFPADFARLGNPAGPIRNGLLIRRDPDFAVGFRVNGESRGSDDMWRRLRTHGIPVMVYWAPWDWTRA